MSTPPSTPASAISYTVIQQYSSSTRIKPQPLADIQAKITKPANKEPAWATHGWSYLMLDLHDVIRFGNITIRNAGTAFLRLLVGDTTQMQQLQRNPSQLSVLDEMSILQPWTQMMSYSHRTDPGGRTRQKTFRSHSRFINGQGEHRCMIIQIRPFEDDPELTMGIAWCAIYGHKTPIASFIALPPLSMSASQFTRTLANSTATSTSPSPSPSTSSSSVLTSPPACPTHHQPCLLRKFRKPGPLHGHIYYVCAEKSGDRDCDYKQWADPADTKLESTLKSSSSSTSTSPDSTPIKRKAEVVEMDDDDDEHGEKRMKTE